jgi:ribosomal protein L7/L12
MPGTYSLILRACPEECRGPVAQLLGRAFSLKDSTCTSIASSLPIVLLSDLSRDESSALSLALAPLQQRGATIEFSQNNVDELPKIDWPRRPMVFKREIAEHVADCQMPIACPGCHTSHSLLDLLASRLGPGGSRPVTALHRHTTQEFRGTQLPEITPFSSQMLTPTPPPAVANGTGETDGGDGDPLARLNELFPEEESGFMPNSADITSILNRLLPDEDVPASSPTTTPGPMPQPDLRPTPAMPAGTSMSTRARIAVDSGSGGYAVFLAKITDEARRAKVVGIIAELTGLSQDEADVLSKKVIIPVLKGVTKEEAEAAKQRFAKVGILARVKAPEA